MKTAKELSQAWMDAFARRDYDRIRELCHPEYIGELPDGHLCHGAQHVVESVQKFAEVMPQLRFEGTYHEVSDTICIVEGVVRGAGPTPDASAGGQPTLRIMAIYECRDGRIWRKREYVTGVSVLDLLGLEKDFEHSASTH